MGLLRDLAEYVSAFGFESLSSREVAKVKSCLLDWLAVALAGSGEEVSRLTRGYALSVGGGEQGRVQGQALVLGALGTTARAGSREAGGTGEVGVRVAPPFAALVNGTAGHALDYDDVTTLGSGHPSAPVVPAALAVGDQLGSSGRDVLAAIAAGITVELALGLPIMPGHYRQGFHNSATLGRLGAAAAACVLAGLEPDRCRAALAAAVTTAAGLRSSFGTMLKSVQVGWAAMGGVVAAGLAREGVTGPDESIEGQSSLYDAMAPSVDPGILEVLRRGLKGERLSGEFGGVTQEDASLSECMLASVRLKAYPACLSTHGAIAAALEARARLAGSPGGDVAGVGGEAGAGSTVGTPGSADDTIRHVEDIECKVHPLCLDIAADPAPASGLAAKFSVQYCSAMALLDGAVTLGSFTDASVARPEVRELAGKVRVLGEDGYARRRECELAIRLSGGKTVTTHTHLFTPLTPDEEWRLARAKLDEGCALYFEGRGRDLPAGRAAGSRERASRIADAVRDLERLDDIRVLTSLLGGPA